MTTPEPGHCCGTVDQDGPHGTAAPAPGRSEHAGTDADFARRVLVGSGIAERVEFDAPDEEPFRFRYAARRDLHVELLTVHSSGLRGTFTAGDRTVLVWSTGTGMEVTDGDRVVRAHRGAPVLLPSTGAFDVVVPAGTLRVVAVDAPFTLGVRGIVAGRGHRDATPSLTPDHRAVPAFRSAVEAVAAASVDHDASRERRLSLQVHLVQAVLRAYHPSGRRPVPVGGTRATGFDLDDPAAEVPHATGPAAGTSAAEGQRAATATVERAEAHLAAHCHEAITLDSLCSAIGVGARTLQIAFLRERDTTPMTFLREMRLDRVRLSLAAADPKQTGVAEIAQRWGFRHMGRFSASYQDRFGEYPLETLRWQDPEAGRIQYARA